MPKLVVAIEVDERLAELYKDRVGSIVDVDQALLEVDPTDDSFVLVELRAVEGSE